MSSKSEQKIVKIEHFVNEKLKKDLKLTIDAGDAIYAEISEYLELQHLLEKFLEMGINGEDGMNTMVDMGCNFYVKARVPNFVKIYVDIGMGFHLEMTHDEALDYIKERTQLLNERAEVFRKKSFEIKAKIKVCLEGLREIQSLDVDERPEFRDVFS